MLVLVPLIILNVILTIYAVYRWRSTTRLEAAFKDVLPKPELPAMSPDVLRSMMKHPSYLPKRNRHVGRRR